MKWETVKLADCCSSIADGDHQPPPKAEVGVPFVTISNINSSNQFDFSNTMFVPQEYYDGLDSKRKAQVGDVLYSVVGSFGIPVLIKGNTPFVFQRHIAILRPNERILPSFLYYTMRSSDFYAKADAAAIGAAQRTVSLSALRNMEIALPSLEMQKAIVSILSAYDDLIENNQKQIKLLEEAAQRLYKEWFIDLRFPGHESTPIHDGIPAGWEKHAIEDLCVRVNAGGTPSRTKSNYWNNASILWFKTGELQDCWLIDSDERISEEGLNNSSAKLFPANTILMAIYASPTLGRLGILSKHGACNQAALCLLADENRVSWQWLYHKLFELRDDFNAVAKGAGQQNISADVVKKKNVIVPSKDIVNHFTEKVKPMYEGRLILRRQIAMLAEARDRLLPKLMSGEIEV